MMLTQKLLELFRSLRLTGMADALERQLTQPATHETLSFEERLGLLIDAEASARENRRIERLLRAAKLRYGASVHDINYRHPRGLAKSRMASLVNGDWCWWLPQSAHFWLRPWLGFLRFGQRLLLTGVSAYSPSCCLPEAAPWVTACRP